MAQLAFVQGDATQPIGGGPKVIAHVCNDVGGWGAGFVLALSRRWQEPEEDYRRWFRVGAEEPFELGQVRFVPVPQPGGELWVANMLGQHGLRVLDGVPPIRYPAVEQALTKVGAFASDRGASVHMPRIGCGLAGGRWEEMEPYVRKSLVEAGVEVTVYDFAQGSAQSP